MNDATCYNFLLPVLTISYTSLQKQNLLSHH